MIGPQGFVYTINSNYTFPRLCSLMPFRAQFFVIKYLHSGSVVDQEKVVSLFLDEMSLAAVQLVHISRLKIKTRLFLDICPKNHKNSR